MSSSGSNSAVVLELAEEFLQRYRQGQRPSLKEYVDRHPKLAAEIKEVFPAMAMMENIALADDSLSAGGQAGGFEAAPLLEKLGDYRIIREVGRGGMGVVYEAEQISLGRHVALKVMPNRSMVDARQKLRFEREAKAAAKLHHTNIVPVFGVGEHDGLPYYVMQFIQGLGMNEVLEELKHIQGNGAPAATGELPVSRRHQSAADVARSLLTGKVQAGPAEGDRTVDQPAGGPGEIPSVNDPHSKSGSLSGSSVVLPGQSDDSMKQGKRNYWQSIANIGVQVAGALDYAHLQGILHRDIKPSNLLLDTRGTVWVTDFGLAKADDQQNLTTTGDILGTLRYMPPEAFEGKSDRRGDVYALGLTLYELLAMKPAYGEKDRHRLIKQVTSTEAPRLDTINPAIPRDLVTIVHKAIDRDPAHRYPSAGELAADLRRYLDDEPIHARRLSGLERCSRWCRRNPLVAGLTAAIIIVAAVGFVTTFIQMRAAQDNAAESQDNAKTAQRHLDERQLAYANLEKAQDNLRGTLYAARMNLIPAAWESGNVHRVLDLLEQAKPGPGESDLRGFEWHYWNRMCHAEKRSLKVAPKFFSPVFSGDGSRIADVGVDERDKKRHVWLKVWDATTALQQLETELLLQQREDEGQTFIFRTGWVKLSRDGSRVAVLPLASRTAQIDNSLRVWDVSTAKLLADIPVKGSFGFGSFAFSDQGDKLAFQIMASQPSPTKPEPVRGLVQLHGVDGAHKPLELDVNGNYAATLSFSPNGKFLACWTLQPQDPKLPGNRGATVLVWNCLTGERLWSTDAPGDWGTIGFTPDGAHVSATFENKDGGEQTVVLYDSQTGKEARRHTFPGFGPIPTIVAFSLDSKDLTLLPEAMIPGPMSSDTMLNIWDVTSGRKKRTIMGHRAGVQACAFAAGQLRTATTDGTVYEWDARPEDESLASFGNTRWRLGGDANIVSGDCAWFLSATGLWRPEGMFGGPLANKELGPPGIRVVDFAGKLLRTFEDHRLPVAAFAVERRGTGVASLGLPPGKDEAREGELLLWQADSGKLRLKIAVPYPQPAAVAELLFSPDGRRLAVTLQRMDATKQFLGPVHFLTTRRVFDVVTGKELLATPEFDSGSIDEIQFGPDGQWLAACLGPAGIKVWDLATGEEKWTVRKAGWVANGSEFAPSGRILAVTGASRVAQGARGSECRFYNVADGKELHMIESGNAMGSVRFSADGKWFAVVETGSDPNGEDGRVRVFDAANWEERVVLRGQGGLIITLEFTPDGRRLAVASLGSNGKGTVKLWDPATGHELLSLSRACMELRFSPDGYRLVGIGSGQSFNPAQNANNLANLWDAEPMRK